MLKCMDPYVLKGYKKRKGNEVVYHKLDEDDPKYGMMLPCGKCICCKNQRRASYYTRLLMHKLQYEDKECFFVTLTYEDNFVTNGIKYIDFQRFIKRLRDHELRNCNNSNVTYYVACEYGSKTLRPHFHVILFGVKNEEHIHKAWQFGFRYVGNVTEKSMMYVAGYCVKLDYDQEIELRAKNARPEFCKWSQGLGANIVPLLADMVKKLNLEDCPASVNVGSVVRAVPKYIKKKVRELCFNSQYIENMKKQLLSLYIKSFMDIIPLYRWSLMYHPDRNYNKEQYLLYYSSLFDIIRQKWIASRKKRYRFRK